MMFGMRNTVKESTNNEKSEMVIQRDFREIGVQEYR